MMGTETGIRRPWDHIVDEAEQGHWADYATMPNADDLPEWTDLDYQLRIYLYSICGEIAEHARNNA